MRVAQHSFPLDVLGRNFLIFNATVFRYNTLKTGVYCILVLVLSVGKQEGMHSQEAGGQLLLHLVRMLHLLVICLTIIV